MSLCSNTFPTKESGRAKGSIGSRLGQLITTRYYACTRQESPLTAPTERGSLTGESLKSPRHLAWGRGFWVVVALVSGLLISLWALVPWPWSPVDDPGQVLAMRDLITAHSYFGALIERTVELVNGDFTGGVFRPVARVYSPLFY